MRKIRIAQIGMNRHSHGEEIFMALKNLTDVFEIVGYALVEDEREACAHRLSVFRGYPELTLDEILNELRPGVSEREIAARLIYWMLHFGAENVSFDPIVVSGANGSMPHGVPGDKLLCEGEFVTMDFGCKYRGYCSDMTRTVALGHVTDEMAKVYHTVLEAQTAGIAAARSGITGKEADAAARDVIEKAGYGEYFGHSFGHGVGVEIHESPNLSPLNETLLPSGAVVSAEPGIYLPGRFGVRIEDVLVLRDDGCEDITKAPKDLLIL